MNRKLYLLLILTLPGSFALADEEVDKTVAEAQPEEKIEAAEPGGPKKMSGMSILGNEETPKSLVIVPWKSSEMGDDIGLSDTLEDRAQPVDKEVFLRELEYFEIRSGE
ncbi:MAG: hypothetical protein MUO51_02555 [Woeseiaceae bacterium]|jgi:hypothetical protein|nr:hypothetical protein [Woeseiaceae bacterium]